MKMNKIIYIFRMKLNVLAAIIYICDFFSFYGNSITDRKILFYTK